MLALGSDHAGYGLKQEIMAYIKELGYEYKDYGTFDTNSCNYPEFAYKAACAVASGECDKGIIICGSGIGISISANKVKGIRCALCSEPYSAQMTRRHNDANVLAMGARMIGIDIAKEIVQTFLTTEFEGGRHQKRINEISQIENGEVPHII